jgi:hypothetical protein
MTRTVEIRNCADGAHAVHLDRSQDSRYSLGVKPTRFLKTALKYC